jgi:tetratricopeptide (TPR) repeat protein
LATRAARRRGALAAALLVLVCALAFLLASTPARNSDLWLHLASGRALARGEGLGGVDPFASTTAGTVWVNHSWLADLALYGIYQLGDGRALVVAKAAGVAVLAALFFLFWRRGASPVPAALAGAAAVVALGPWLALQPVLFSLAGVVLTLHLLEPGRRRWLLLPLFALWANIDGWFVLGPALVGLYALGEALRFPRDKGELRSLALMFVLGLAACLLTPYHYRIFAWPTPLGLTNAERALMGTPLGQGLVIPAFAAPWATAPALSGPGGWAYCLLLAGGMVFFALCGRRAHPGRLLAWLALAALSLYQARAIPFFAVAAGPVLALNLQEWAAARDIRMKKIFRIPLVSLSSVLLICLLVLAWPGWLQPAPYHPRAWVVEQDESLVRLADTLGRWHAGGRLRPDRIALTFSPEAAHYLAWFCPDERGFFDSRWPLFGPVADDYVAMRRCLLRPEGSGPDPALGPLLDAHRIDRVILHDTDFGRTSLAFRCLLLGGDEWELLALEGDTALFGRRGGGSTWEPFDLRRAAYRPRPGLTELPAAARAPGPPRRLDAFWRTRDDRPADRAEAALYLIAFDLGAERGQARLEEQWLCAQAGGLLALGPEGGAAGTVAALASRLALTPRPPAPTPPALTRESVQAKHPLPPAPVAHARPDATATAAEQFASAFLGSHDRGPTEALLLAVRAARRALAANPDDAGAFLLLGEAYLRLARQTREPSWQGALPLLGLIRRAQALTALEEATRLRPDLDAAHSLLAQYYYEQGQMDRALDHLRARLPLVERRAAAGPAGTSGDDAVSALRQDVEALEAVVSRSEKVYAANTAGKSASSEVLERARVAARHGLTRKALDMLLRSSPAIFGKAGTQTQLDLMLQGGRAYDVRDWVEPEHEVLLGFTPYHSLRAQAAVACGDYAAADAELDQLSGRLREVGISRDQVIPVRGAVSLAVGRAILAGPAAFGAGAAGLAGAGFEQFEVIRPVGSALALPSQEADSEVLRGLLALECGAVEIARGHFRAALRVWGDGGGAAIDFRSRPIAEYEMRLLED